MQQLSAHCLLEHTSPPALLAVEWNCLTALLTESEALFSALMLMRWYYCAKNFKTSRTGAACYL